MKYAIVIDGVVVNVVISESPLAANWIRTDTAGIGWTYDGTTFYPPVIPQEV